MPTIYKITPASAWREAERQGVYKGSADDLRDGYIHFSTAAQVGETARKHYFGQTGLFLVAVDAGALGDALRWEPSRNDELFPHLYGELDLGAVTAILEGYQAGTRYGPEAVMTEQLIRLYESTSSSPCKACGTKIQWHETLNGRSMPMNYGSVPRRSETGADGRVYGHYASSESHWNTCPNRDQFKSR